MRFAEFEELVELFLQVWSCNVYCAVGGCLRVEVAGFRVWAWHFLRVGFWGFSHQGSRFRVVVSL